MNICVQLFVWTYFHFSCWTPKNGIAGIAISISLLKTAKLSFKVVAPFYTPAGRLTAPFDILTNTWDCQCFKILTIWVCVYRYHIVTLICISLMTNDEFPWWVSGKESACQCWRRRSHLWVRKIPWKRRWQPLQNSCLGNPMDIGAWWATVHGVVKEWDMTERLNNND